jgi:hypothetical protein
MAGCGLKDSLFLIRIPPSAIRNRSGNFSTESVEKPVEKTGFGVTSS